MPPTSLIATCCFAATLLVACTSVSSPTSSSTGASNPPSASPTPAAPSMSSSPTSTLSAAQLAAIDAVDGYRAASVQIGNDPSSFTEAQMRSLLGKWAGAAVVKSNVASYLWLKKKGFRYDTGTKVLSTKASEATDVGYGTQVVVTRCIDQSPAKVLDRSGAEVSAKELGYTVPQLLLRQYTVQKRTGKDAFLVYGLAPTKGQCGPS